MYQTITALSGKENEWHASKFIPGKQERAPETEIAALIFLQYFSAHATQKETLKTTDSLPFLFFS